MLCCEGVVIDSFSWGDGESDASRGRDEAFSNWFDSGSTEFSRLLETVCKGLCTCDVRGLSTDFAGLKLIALLFRIEGLESGEMTGEDLWRGD